ncbi:MAG: type II toxin-antitoxin system HicB family antitoxin [Lachnoclostridium sp.]|nr:type II toxin-antitoxin system HicB family antitoxin [Lachnoclostridium sp.]
MKQKEIKVLVSWSGENFNGGVGDPELGAIMVAGSTLENFKKKFEEALEFHIDGLKEDGNHIPDYIKEGNYTIVYDLEATALLKEAEKFTTLAAISRATGINQKQLSHYATGLKQPRPSSRERIIQGLHAIGRMALALY